MSDEARMPSMIATDYFIEYGRRTSLELFDLFRVLLVSPGSGGVVLSVLENQEQVKMEFWFHVLQAPCPFDQPRWFLIGSAMGVMGSLHAFYEIPSEGKR